MQMLHMCVEVHKLYLYMNLSHLTSQWKGLLFLTCNMKLKEYSHYAASQEKNKLQLQLEDMNKVSSSIVQNIMALIATATSLVSHFKLQVFSDTLKISEQLQLL